MVHKIHCVSFVIIGVILTAALGCASQTQQISQTGNKKTFWVQSGRHPDYPDSLFILGVGLANLSVDPVNDRSLADGNALGEIAKQIKARVKVKDVHITMERMVSDMSLDVTTRDSSLSVSEIYSDLVLQGFSFVDRYTDRDAGIVYTCAVLDRKKAASVLKEDIENLHAYYTSCMERTDELMNKHQFMRALWYVKEAGMSHSLGSERLAVARFILHPLTQGALSWLALFDAPIHSLKKAEEILTHFILEKEGGDTQKVMLGTVPNDPLKVGLYYQLETDRYPVKGAMIHFQFKQGGGSLYDSVFTDRNGSAICMVKGLDPSVQSYYDVSAVLDLSHLWGHQEDLPDSLVSHRIRFSAARRNQYTTRIGST